MLCYGRNKLLHLFQHNGMAPIKILTCQARSINHYKDVRTKVMKCCANICFNRQCLTKKVIPKYANVRITYTSPATNITQKIHTIRRKDEIKCLYKEKEKLNTDLYNIRLKVAQEWGNTWHIIQDYFHKSTNHSQDFNSYKLLINPLNAELNPTCQLLALLGTHHILHVSRIRVNTRH